MDGSTAALARHLTGLRFADLPAPIVTLAKLCVLDLTGVMVAGAGEPAARIAAGVVAREYGAGPCTLAGRTERTTATGAALANGTAAHALDFDDVVTTMGHPSAPALPAALAVAERTGATGRDLLTAFTAGFETQTRVAAAIGPSHYARGFHSTATFGTFGAAAAATRLLGLDAERTTAALGIAGTQAAGLKAMFGTMCKPLHAGRAAMAGVLAAELAADGFTSGDDVLGAPQGFADTQSDTFDAAVAAGGFGDPWRMEGVRFKVHAACFLTHASINALLHLRRTAGIAADDVARVDVTVPPGHLAVCAIPEPRTGLEGKFSLRYTAALALTHGAADPSRFTDELVADPRLTDVRDRVTVLADDRLTGPVATVAVKLADGRELTAEHDTNVRPWADDPGEQTADLLGKFHAMADPVLGAGRARELADTVLALDGLDDVRGLAALTAPAS
ncbi:MAG TPA: MmgE/PrpD family protein [Streptosporangiaceae bacterium]|jgi:2-methylcitrate dehydratase PrpD